MSANRTVRGGSEDFDKLMTMDARHDRDNVQVTELSLRQIAREPTRGTPA